jgi:hypothetical protein
VDEAIAIYSKLFQVALPSTQKWMQGPRLFPVATAGIDKEVLTDQAAEKRGRQPRGLIGGTFAQRR